MSTPGMELFVLVVTVLPFLCWGIVVELTATPSTVREGGQLTLTCSADETITAASFYYNNTRMEVKLVGGECKDATPQTCNQQCSCNPDGKSFNLTIFNVSRSLDKERFLCRAQDKVSKSFRNSSNLEISVTYPPTGNVVMSPSGTYRIQTGTTVTLECRVKGGNPLATLTWKCIGSPVTGQNLSNDTTAFSRLGLEVKKTYHQKQCLCIAKHLAIQDRQFGTASVRFDILYKPVITLERSTAYVNESLDFNRTCSAQGNPSPNVTWYRGANILQSNGILSISKINRTDAGVYVCNATSGPTGNLQSTEQFRIVVQYGPDVDLVITNTTENTTDVPLVCTARGVPDKYTFRWRHMVGSTLIRDAFDHVTSSGSVSTLTISSETYENRGTYVCEASNGYKGRFGRTVQTVQAFLHVNGSPKAIRAQNIYVTGKNTPLNINITYVSFPEALNTSILRTDSASPPRDGYSFTVSPVPVVVSFYDKTVSVDGYVVQLHFNKFETKDQGQYQLYVWNVYAYYYNFKVIISDKPDSPTQLVINQIATHSAVVSWTPGEDNGNIQTFTLTCQENNGEIHANVILNQTTSSYTLDNLDAEKKYDITVYAGNAMGKSNSITITFKIGSSNVLEKTDRRYIPIIIGVAAVSAAVGLLIACIVVTLICRRKQLSESNKMKDNMKYESAGSYYPKGKANVVETKLNAEVHKPQSDDQESSLNAEVQKIDETVVNSPVEEVKDSSVFSQAKETKRSSAAQIGEDTVTDNDGTGDDTDLQNEERQEGM